jgi:hypothetical protein
LGRLRSKLKEYFATEGSRDAITIEIPKGSYKLVFSHRASLDEAAVTELALSQEAVQELPPRAAAPSVVTGASDPSRLAPSGWRLALVLVAVFLLGGAVSFLATWLPRRTAVPDLAQTPAVLTEFWRPFLTNREMPLVVFGEVTIAVDPGKSFRLLEPGGGAGQRHTDLATGVGEVVGVHQLGLLLGRLNRSIQVKRARLLSLDEVQERDVIFVGGWVSNPDMRNILPPADISLPGEGSGGNTPSLGRGSQPRQPAPGSSGNAATGSSWRRLRDYHSGARYQTAALDPCTGGHNDFGHASCCRVCLPSRDRDCAAEAARPRWR